MKQGAFERWWRMPRSYTYRFIVERYPLDSRKLCRCAFSAGVREGRRGKKISGNKK